MVSVVLCTNNDLFSGCNMNWNLSQDVTEKVKWSFIVQPALVGSLKKKIKAYYGESKLQLFKKKDLNLIVIKVWEY